MDVKIGSRWKDVIAEAVESGRYASEEDFINEGLRLAAEKEHGRYGAIGPKAGPKYDGKAEDLKQPFFGLLVASFESATVRQSPDSGHHCVEIHNGQGQLRGLGDPETFLATPLTERDPVACLLLHDGAGDANTARVKGDTVRLKCDPVGARSRPAGERFTMQRVLLFRGQRWNRIANPGRKPIEGIMERP